MKKEFLKESIKNVEDGIKQAEKNVERANYQLEEGRIVLKALKEQCTNI